MSKNNESPQSTLTSLSDAIVSVAEKVSPSVVGVQTGRMFGGGAGGSGVIWSSDGYIVTCYHVVKGFREVQISSQELGSVMRADVVGKDPYSDIALLKISNTTAKSGKALQPIEIPESGEDLKAGQIVLALANPFGEQASITKGIITSSRSSVRGWWGRTMMNNVVITDARLNPGYSGGPLVDISGKMIGLNAFYVSSRGIAIRTSKIKGIVENLKSYGRVRRAYLGITSYPISIPEEVTRQ
ncbi:MAG TPA: trypsin-like peptidase domain-containing protein, partial [Nitrososphaera sp.]|nr:trypsin-like peptidase domain-containing protein [Nitrososphaera sp.]